MTLCSMQTQLAELNQALAENLQSRSQLDSILEETESAYSKIVEGSQVRAHTSCRVLESFPVYGFEVQPTGRLLDGGGLCCVDVSGGFVAVSVLPSWSRYWCLPGAAVHREAIYACV